MLLDGSEMDSFADLTHTPQGDVKNEAMFSLLPKFKNLTHTPQGDVNMGTIKNATGGDEPTHTPQGDVKFSQNNSKCRSELEPTHTPQGDKQTEGTFLHCIDAAEKFLLLF